MSITIFRNSGRSAGVLGVEVAAIATLAAATTLFQEEFESCAVGNGSLRPSEVLNSFARPSRPAAVPASGRRQAALGSGWPRSRIGLRNALAKPTSRTRESMGGIHCAIRLPAARAALTRRARRWYRLPVRRRGFQARRSASACAPRRRQRVAFRSRPSSSRRRIRIGSPPLPVPP